MIPSSAAAGVDDEDDQGHHARRGGVHEGEEHRRDARQGPADLG